ncbi:MAG: hypothetical protein R2910_07555 [Gemmatimonadales bacterium]
MINVMDGTHRRGAALGLLLAAAVGATGHAQGEFWPREIPAKNVTVVIYQPQVDSLRGNQLYSRAAMALEQKGKEPIFGMFWSVATISTDRDTRVAEITGLKVTEVRWPDATADQQKKFSDLVEQEVPKWDMPISMEQLNASLAASEQQIKLATDLRSTPPEILVSEVPAVLVVFEGEPILRKIDGTSYERAVNTPFAVISDPAKKTFYLSNGWDWYAAPSIVKGPWTYTTNVPADIRKMVPPDSSTDEPEDPKSIKILVATKPTELLTFGGTPAWTPISGTDILYAKNTETPVLRLLSSQDIYTLISGRWFRARSFKGPWEWVDPEKLPADFAQIPKTSPVSDVLASVPGTPEAEDALRDAQMPQTAVINRSDAKLTVQYDGEPKFVDIPGTSVKYAENTATQVLLIDKRYYAVDNAVWFTSASAKGPWVVADSVPAAVKTIPPSSPVYNVQYVQIYQSTPQVVYVGYTPGYIGFYPYYGTVVYGTGYYYPPYVSPVVYYPRPVTYGMHVTYNPYTGWGFGVTASNGFMTVGVHFGSSYYRGPCCYGGGWYGYGGYRPPPPYYRPPGYGYPPYRPPGYRPPPPAYRPPAYRPPPPGARPTPYAGTRPANLYNDAGNRGRVSTQPSTLPTNRPNAAPTASTRQNNVYADKSGNVYRQNSNGTFDQRQGNDWKPSASTGGATPSQRPTTGAQPPSQRPPTASTMPSQRPSTATPSTRPSTSQQLNRDAQARQRGAQNSRPMPQRSAPARSSGGTRRR